MTLTNNIIAEMVSYIDFADIREFVKNYPELIEKETIKDLIFGSFLLETTIRRISTLDFVICMKGADIK